MARSEVRMSGGVAYYLVLYTSLSGTTVYSTLYWRRAEGASSSSYNGAAPWSIQIAGSFASGTHNFNAPAGGAISETYIGGHSYNSVGYPAVAVSGSFDTDTSAAGAGGLTQYVTIASAPPAPTSVGFSNTTTTTSMYQFSSTGDGGSPIIRWEFQLATNPSFTGARLFTSTGTTNITGLLPGTTYYARARGVNAVGPGAWSGTSQTTTLAATAPSLSVAPTLTGTEAQVDITRSETMPAVDVWILEYRPVGSTTATRVEFPESSRTITGLVQGQVYQWRVAGRRSDLGATYTSPFTAWLNVQQPDPNTTSGTYFDGNTPDADGVVYTWDGTANKSASRATAPGVLGWTATFSQGSTGAMYRQVGGRSQEFSARVTFHSDATSAGALSVHQRSDAASRSPVSALGTYFGSIYVQLPERAQRLQLQMEWRTASGAFISAALGTPTVVPQNPGSWHRLTVEGVAPASAAFATLRLIDVAGTGFSAWRGGDSIVLDDAMIALGLYDYFDGESPDTSSFDHDWLGGANASVSTRTPVPPDEEADPLADPDCPPPPAPPRPPAIDDECIEEITIWRRYWATIPETEVRHWLAAIPTMRITSGAQATRQVRIRIYENPDGEDPESFTNLQGWMSEQIISYIPPGATFILDGISERAYAEVNGEIVPADHMLFGTGGVPATWPVLRCGTSYLASFDVPLDAQAGNLGIEVALTQRF